ncbi:hypothetical protein F5878DRAFT_603705 [Lentinula raphanica]|uniref:Uncharacterized protein n=1 Tax=Lentinula raphanica TaxID=153919 RepID=A0AA38PJ20_9AGAR|nr:hypothetical protein F5878DRAFT_603705 [Lentinula raphanica]
MRLNAAVFLACNILAPVAIHVSSTPVPTPTISLNALSSSTTHQTGEAHKPSGQQGREVVHFSFCTEEEKTTCQHAPEDSSFEAMMVQIVHTCVAAYTRSKLGKAVRMVARDHFPVAYQNTIKEFLVVFFENALGIEGEGVAFIGFPKRHNSDRDFKLSLYEGTWKAAEKKFVGSTVAKVYDFRVHNDRLMENLYSTLDSYESKPRNLPSVPSKEAGLLERISCPFL